MRRRSQEEASGLCLNLRIEGWIPANIPITGNVVSWSQVRLKHNLPLPYDGCSGCRCLRTPF